MQLKRTCLIRYNQVNLYDNNWRIERLHHCDWVYLFRKKLGWTVMRNSHKALCQGSIGTHLLTLVHLYLSSYSLNTITHSVCATDGCTSGTCKLTITHTHRAWTCRICVMDQWPLAPLRHPWMFACFPSNKMRLKGGVCNCSWDNVKTNTAHWYRAMLQEDVRGHNGGKQSVGQVVAGLLGDNGKGLIS